MYYYDWRFEVAPLTQDTRPADIRLETTIVRKHGNIPCLLDAVVH